jgi:hypothetical protein
MTDVTADLASVERPLTIEVPEAPRTTACERCGRSAVNTTGFVYRGGDAYAIYHAVLHRHDDRPAVDLAIGIGTWQTDDSVAEASAFLVVWPSHDEIQFGFVDPADSAWVNARLLRNQLSAEAARVSKMRTALIAVGELVVASDPSVASHLA